MRRLLLFLFLLSGSLLMNCESPRTAEKYESLTDDQKRLPENALRSMRTAAGLEVQQFAAEPMITNPTNITIDKLGRVWVCEAYNYDVAPEKADPKGNRIIVLEDANQDGMADKRTVFYQGEDLFLPLGVTVLDDKIYVTCSPNVLVFTDSNYDLVPEKKEVLFSKMGKGEHSAHSMSPGPDGMIYFSLGNYTRNIADKEGKALIDKAGFSVFQSPYIGGMVLRCTPDGKNIEVLGHNFRNNYEPCIDAYGNVWQSDNDDDGNESCRVNFVMYYGNYGFQDEMSKASWTTSRLNMEEITPQKHWHQNDPGVVPNVLITGAGSPAGMTFYEGDLLPDVFKNVPIHAEPYYNVVRAYIPAKKGAGYTLEIEDLLKSEDKWFRPVDVASAPDGSLFIADWYDPILGGGAAGDADKGRIYRVAPNVKKYSITSVDLASIDGAIDALKNANSETRFAAFQFLNRQGNTAVPSLRKLWNSENPTLRARVLWLLSKQEENDSFLREALSDRNPDIRIAAIRAVVQNKENVVPYLQAFIHEEDISVRREVAVALRYAHSQEAANLWASLAQQYDGKDRWYLEALGIGSDLHADLFFSTWQQKVNLNLDKKQHQDLIWRIRSCNTLPLLAALIKATDDGKMHEKYFRAFDFHRCKEKTRVLTSLVRLPHKRSKEISSLALRQMEGGDMKITPVLHAALEDALEETKGTVAFVNLVEKFSLHNKQNDLLQMAVAYGDEESGATATELLLKLKAFKLLKKVLHANDSSTMMLLQSLRGKGNPDAIMLVSSVVEDSTNQLIVRNAAAQILGSSWPGEERLLDLVKSSTFPKELKPLAASILFNVYRSRIQREAAAYLPKPSTKGKNLPSVKQLLASTGNVKQGKAVFVEHCTLCHRVKEAGVKFGPELSQIGSKLAKEGLYRAIVYPDEGISHGYESTIVELKDNTESMGIVASETAREIVLNLPGGATLRHEKENIKAVKKDSKSLMPSLAAAMSEQELVDLVEYLASLKK